MVVSYVEVALLASMLGHKHTVAYQLQVVTMLPSFDSQTFFD